VPPKAALPRRKITFSFKTKKSARAKSKNVKAIFMLGSALTRGAAGLRFGSRAKFSPSRSFLFARSPKCVGEFKPSRRPYLRFPRAGKDQQSKSSFTTMQKCSMASEMNAAEPVNSKGLIA
jgi:hypothetical protein